MKPAMSWRVISSAVLLAVATAVSAAPWPPELKECAAQKDPAARLACYDRAAAAAESSSLGAAAAAESSSSVAVAAAESSSSVAVAAAESSSSVASPTSTPAAASHALPLVSPSTHAGRVPPPAASVSQKDPQTDPDYGLEGTALRRKQRERGELPALTSKPQPLVAHVVDVTRIGQAEVTVRLDNGQVWKQTDGAGNLTIAPRDTVTITAGSLGGYFLTCADRRVVHVKRIQ
jgi:hypothetical protein